MKKFTNLKFKTNTCVALLMILSITQTAFAQVAANASSTPAAADSNTALIDTSSNNTATSTLATSTSAMPTLNLATQQPLVLQGSVSVMQDATTTQPAVTSQVLESTTNPELASSTDTTSMRLVDSSTSTPATLSTTLLDAASSAIPFPVDESASLVDVVAQNIVATPLPALPIVSEPQREVKKPTVAAVIDATPEPEFTFALTGKQIPTIRKVESKDGNSVAEQEVAAPVMSTVDNVKGEISVSGECSDAYFVVLLFKNANDYADDPRSYIVNRAYPCVGGAFSYSIADLPSSLPNGNYYLLVGEEGSRGAWKPITSQTEITINKK